MTLQQKNNLAKGSILLIRSINKNKKIKAKGRKPFNFNMSAYLTDKSGKSVSYPKKYECGTCCCFLGFMVIAMKNKSLEKAVSFPEFGYKNITKAPSVSYFLFGSSWPNDPIQCAKRALYILGANENCCWQEDHEYFHVLREHNSEKTRFYEAMNNRTLINHLKKHLINEDSNSIKG